MYLPLIPYRISLQKSIKHAISVTSDVYSTDHKAVGHALVISQEKFSLRLKQEGFGDRAGNHMDENILKRTLESMGIFQTQHGFKRA